ncbi:hypothetical protein PAEPH01_0036 [Pancytospora epiphaga]|nr:hypothetical protein PAEPH01_0036 [Pancytospora epiphaga]
MTLSNRPQSEDMEGNSSESSVNDSSSPLSNSDQTIADENGNSSTGDTVDSKDVSKDGDFTEVKENSTEENITQRKALDENKQDTTSEVGKLDSDSLGISEDDVKKYRKNDEFDESLSHFLNSREFLTTEKIKELTKVNIFEIEGKKRGECISPFLQSKIISESKGNKFKLPETPVFCRAASLYLWEEEGWQHICNGQAILDNEKFVFKRTASEPAFLTFPYRMTNFKHNDGYVIFNADNYTSTKHEVEGVNKKYKLTFSKSMFIDEFMNILNQSNR